jgi:hypothetical protein
MVLTFAKSEHPAQDANSLTLYRIFRGEYWVQIRGNPQQEEADDEVSDTKDRTASKEIEKNR